MGVAALHRRHCNHGTSALDGGGSSSSNIVANTYAVQLLACLPMLQVLPILQLSSSGFVAANEQTAAVQAATCARAVPPSLALPPPKSTYSSLPKLLAVFSFRSGVTVSLMSGHCTYSVITSVPGDLTSSLPHRAAIDSESCNSRIHSTA
eukprot:16851-Heterococcus_DN1.PRE.1